MLRRRRPRKNEAIHFSFDSFLDLVTNVVGIIIRLILATWIGARSYHASMQWVELETVPAQVIPGEPLPELPPPKITDDPLYSTIDAVRQEIEDAKARLTAQIKELETVEKKHQQMTTQFVNFAGQRAALDTEHKQLIAAKSQRAAQSESVSLSLDEIRRRSKKLIEDIKLLESLPPNKKLFKYHAPVSRAVHSDEVSFECKNGRVTFFDQQGFMLEIKQSLEGISTELRTQWKVERTTPSIGPFRMRYTVERERGPLEQGTPPSGGNFRYGPTAWVLEPITEQRGETLQAALTPRSEFRQMVDPLDGNISTVTFWVYPDSFEMFRQLRDYLYERGLDVAGRPLPPLAPIQANKHGTASRGQ